jgi:hypothetical protein
METSLIGSIPSAEQFLKTARNSEKSTIELINNTLMREFQANIGKESFKFSIVDITRGYKLNEVKKLVVPLFAAYKAKGYCIKYKIYHKYDYYGVLYLKVKSYSFTVPQKPITQIPQVELPPKYTELDITSSKKSKKKSWFWFG